jgi:prevent-host-death family protein
MSKAARKLVSAPAAMSVQGMRAAFADTLNRVAYAKERVCVARHGRAIAALVPIEDLRLLEAAEDARDTREADKVMRRVRSGREKVVPWPVARGSRGA